MADEGLLILRLYENDRRHLFTRPTYEEIVYRLWKNGAPGITVFRDEEGLDAHGNLQSINSDYAYGLPMTMEIYAAIDVLSTLRKEISDLLSPKDELVLIDHVVDAKKESEEGGSSVSTGKILRVYMKEEDHYRHQALYEALLQKLKKHGVRWVDVQRALEGFGQDHVIRKNHLFSLSDHAPLILEAFIEDEAMVRILPDIQPLLNTASGPALLIDANTLTDR